MLNRSRIYVGDLPPHVTENDIQVLFSEIGAVESVQIVLNPTTGRSRGYAFVEMQTAENMAQAIRRFNGYVWEGYMLMVYSVPPRSVRRGESHAEIR